MIEGLEKLWLEVWKANWEESLFLFMLTAFFTFSLREKESSSEAKASSLTPMILFICSAS
jgi:hypothetical protein